MLRCVLCVVVGTLLSVMPVHGQGGVAEINGSASDQTGSALPGATITIVDEATGLQRTSVANESGRFVIVAVTPGRYTVRAELAGFQTQTRTGILVQVGQAITLNLTLPIGGLTETLSSLRCSLVSVFVRLSGGASHTCSRTHDARTRIAIAAPAAYGPAWALRKPLK